MDSNDLVTAIKKAAVEAVKASKPADILFGTVLSANPLRVSVDQRLTLGEPQLVLTRNVTEYTVQMTVQNEEQAVTVYNGLTAGERVVLLQVSGGQQYIVIDRIGGGT